MHLRLTLRALARRPGFTAVVVLTLGLGIGASTAIFSVVNTVLLEPLPYRAPSGLAMIWSRWDNFDKTWLSDAEFVDYQKLDRLFDDVAAWGDGGETAITGDSRAPESVTSVAMTANTLSVLGVSPALGRSFTAAEDVPNGPAVVLIGDEIWNRRWGGDPGILGRTIQIDGRKAEVVGVLPPGFRFPLEFSSRHTAQIVAPLGIDRSASTRGNHNYFGVARLRPGVTSAAASASLAALAAGWTKQGLYPAAMRFTAFTVPLLDEISGPVRPALAILAAAVALLLLLTWANIANLILIRADARSREVAVRTALGAGMKDLIRLAMLESLILGLAGGALGILFAWSGLRLLLAWTSATVPRASEIAIDGRVLLFTMGLTILSGLVFGAIPLWRAARLDLSGALRDGRGQTEGPARRRARSALVVAEMALAVLLLIGAGLTLKSFVNLTRIDTGFDARGLLTLRVALPAERYSTPERALGFFEPLLDRVRHLPGVETAGLVRLLPLASEMGDSGLVIEGKPTPPGEPGRQADWQAASPGYFEAMKIRLVHGRFFTEADGLAGQPVLAINEALASAYFPGEDPIGRRIRLGRPQSPLFTIVGVVGNVLHNGLLAPPKRAFYVPQAQWSLAYGSPRRAMTLVVRTAADPAALLPPVERIVHELDADLPLTGVRMMSQVLASATEEQRFMALLMAAFAALALLLAAVGIYGVISYSVGQRTAEIGIRMALGANAGAVRGLVLLQGLGPALAGTASGLLAAWALTRQIRSILYGVAPVDPATFTLIPVLLLAVAFAAVLVPAVRASRVDPVEALRTE